MRVHESTRGCFPQVLSYFSKFKSTFVGKPKYILFTQNKHFCILSFKVDLGGTYKDGVLRKVK